MTIQRKKLPIAALEKIDDLCARFEQHWRSNQPLTIESMLDVEVSDSERDVLLKELLVLEIDYRQRQGERPTLQEYLDRFPTDANLIHDALQVNQKPPSNFDPPTTQELSKLFPSLEILELVGAGGMGAVYKARQKRLDRVVALKVLPEEFGSDAKFALRFAREARTLAKLNHPNIVSLFEFGSVEDSYYFLMEFVDGSTLRDVIRSGELAPDHALAVVPHLCDALQYAHDNGVVHRDIKPENILIGKDGTIKIADFGLSRLQGGQGAGEKRQVTLTGTHQVMGTPRYMAPEQMEGARDVDHRADIYSLGVVFYEMLTGEIPLGRFAAPSQKVAIDIRLDEVVLRTLEKEPEQRYQAASEIKSDVQSIESSENPAFVDTLINDNSGKIDRESTASLQHQELAARLLLTRRELMQRVRNSLRPLFRGQLIQIFVGIVIIAVGAFCWTQNIRVPHRLISGVILHVYGVAFIASAAHVCTRINRIDYSKPVKAVREQLNSVRTAYLRVGPLIGFPWWVMWIPGCVAIGFDAVLHPASLFVSLAIGTVGLATSLWLYVRAIKSDNAKSQKWTESFAGKSIATAYATLNEIEKANIQ